MAKRSVTCPACNGTGQDSYELQQTRGLHLQEMPTGVFTDEDWGKCKYCKGSGEVTIEKLEQYLRSECNAKKAELRGTIIGGLVGLMVGILFGAYFQESWMPIALGVLGLIIGAIIGFMLSAVLVK
ncbi:MAG: hypothetical protein AMJ94_12045 [Deltaproteobacteria bacterium SM23_61]|nr:MAG: hypothetical protein AMJ94_12045 [Deltaproteobacteria bacterium SM23_61]